MKPGNMLVFLFVLKYALDIFSPFRELNFLLFNFFCFVILLILNEKLKFLTKKEYVLSLIFLIFIFYWSFIKADVFSFLKYSSLILLYITLRVLFMYELDFLVIIKCILNSFVVFMSFSFIISYVVANPLDREFYNFEHANLLGTYLLLSLFFVYLWVVSGINSTKHKILISILTLLSTSTGSFISSLISFLNFKKLNFSLIIYVFFSVFFVFIIFYYLTYLFFNEMNTKVFSPIFLVFDGGMTDLIYLSKFRLPIQELGVEYSSSLLWRFYAYFIFVDHILSQSVFFLIFGNGFGGFKDVWDGIAPHNDFLYIILDFGLLAFLLFIYFQIKLLKFILFSRIELLPLYFVINFRLLFENNLISYYVLSALVMHFIFVFLYFKRFAKCVSC